MTSTSKLIVLKNLRQQLVFNTVSQLL